MGKKKDKTNVMRQLDQHHIPYEHYEWDKIEDLHVEAPVYKTLVTEGKSGDHYVFVIPTDDELDLKKAAKAVGEKNVHMVPQKDLLNLTGYVHGGCSPIGMKKSFLTTIDDSADDLKSFLISGGRVGDSVEMDPHDLSQLVKTQFADVKRKD